MAMNEREKKLMWFLGGSLFLIANAYGWFSLMNAENAAKLKTAKLQGSIARSNGLKTMKPQAEKYREHLSQWLKRYASENDRDEYLTNIISKHVSDLGLNRTKGAPTPTEGLSTEDIKGQAANFIKVGYSGEVVGDWKKVIEFAHLLEDPSEFRWLKSGDFKTRKSEGQDGTVDLVFSFTLQKWWHPDSEMLLAEEAAAGEQAKEIPAAPEKPATAAVTNPTGDDTAGEQAPNPPVVINQ
jgi:hypothetical protein